MGEGERTHHITKYFHIVFMKGKEEEHRIAIEFYVTGEESGRIQREGKGKWHDGLRKTKQGYYCQTRRKGGKCKRNTISTSLSLALPAWADKWL